MILDFSEFGEEIFNTSDLNKQASLKDEFVDVNLQLIKILARKKKVFVGTGFAIAPSCFFFQCLWGELVLSLTPF